MAASQRGWGTLNDSHCVCACARGYPSCSNRRQAGIFVLSKAQCPKVNSPSVMWEIGCFLFCFTVCEYDGGDLDSHNGNVSVNLQFRYFFIAQGPLTHSKAMLYFYFCILDEKKLGGRGSVLCLLQENYNSILAIPESTFN